MTTIKAILGASLWFVLTGCQTVNGVYDQPARIVNPDADSRAALKAAVNEALGTEVMLADDALTDSSLLPVERMPTGSIDDPVRDGLILDKPIMLQLVKNGDDCVLVKLSDGTRYPLSNTDCEVD